MSRLLVLLIGLLVLPGQAAIDAYEFQDPAQERRFRTLIDELRCPKCQNQNISGSDAPLAADLRRRTYQMILDGRSDREILDFMTARYGDFITYRPPLKPITWPLWFGPGLAILGAGLGLAWWLRRRRAEPPASLSGAERRRLDELLARYDEDSNQ